MKLQTKIVFSFILLLFGRVAFSDCLSFKAGDIWVPVSDEIPCEGDIIKVIDKDRAIVTFKCEGKEEHLIMNCKFIKKKETTNGN